MVKNNAARQNYTKALVIDLPGNNKTTADSVANALNGEVGNLPVWETKPNTDILVIIGSDYIKK